ncbi:monocarboxylate permease-like protein [Moniliophthora roreri MCA 2997]|uniref:Monocarboxylate permease-like protein n=2 Tax=Moniliophthora roreri TaxID=221103 RepID=V2W9K7_MONRO|nr:monocarboxylate permease-like protein [Moniliophthora roreri MCA 2997]KAI3619218.1 monocarboxylate permease-like protein [Moniliophthora roreri]
MSVSHHHRNGSTGSTMSDSPQERRSPSPNDLKKGRDSLVVVDSELEAANHATSGFPEGGPDATRTIIGAFMALFVQFGVMNSFGVFEAQYARVNLQSKSPSDIAWIGTCQFFVFFFSGAFVGRFFDSFGARPLLFPGAVILVLSLVATSYCYEFYQFFLAQGLLFGIGSSLVFYPALSSITHWYEQKRGRMMGLVTAGSSLGGVMFPIALNHLIPTLGFPLALRIIACICAAILLPASLLIRTRLPRRPFNRDLGSLVDVGGFKDIKYTLFLVASAITMLGSFNPYYFATLYSETHDYSSNITLYSLAILNAGSFFGRLIPGILADKLGFFNILSIALTVASTILFCWIAVSSAASFIIWLVFYGFFSGAFIALMPACIGKFTPDPSKYGGRAGMLFAFVGTAALCGPPSAGALIEHDHGEFDEMIMFSGVLCLAGAVLYWVARFKATGGKVFVRF